MFDILKLRGENESFINFLCKEISPKKSDSKMLERNKIIWIWEYLRNLDSNWIRTGVQQQKSQLTSINSDRSGLHVESVHQTSRDNFYT